MKATHHFKSFRKSLGLFLLCLCLIMGGSFAFFTDRVEKETSAVAGNLDISFVDISASASGTNGITSNNSFALDQAWTNSIISENGVINPDDYFDLSYTLKSLGNKSMDVRQQLVVTSNVAMTADAEEYTLTITGGNDTTEAVTGTLSNDKLSITYDLTDIILDGVGLGAETEDDSVGSEATYIVQLDFADTAKNAFMDSTVTVNLKLMAKQHRNTANTEWATWENYTSVYEKVDGTPGQGSGGGSDQVAPTVVVASNYLSPEITISNLSASDYPMVVGVYEAEPDGSSCDYTAAPLCTITITGVDGADVSYTGTGIFNAAVTNGDITFNYSAENREHYLGVKVTDAAGNEATTDTLCFVRELIGCFVEGTQVMTVDGLANIEDIHVGDLVYAVNTQTGKKEVAPVLKVHDEGVNNELYTITVGEEVITATPEHLFYVDGQGWLEACELNPGDTLLSMNGSESVIAQIEYTKLDEMIPVYNLSVGEYENFLVTEAEILVHNISKE